MNLFIWAALVPNILAFVSAQSNGDDGATYAPVTTVSVGGYGPTPTNEGPLLPSQTTPAVSPNAGSYKLNSSFEITDTPVTRTFNWIIAYVVIIFQVIQDLPAHDSGIRLMQCGVRCSRFALFIVL
jgi:hypothetical protein